MITELTERMRAKLELQELCKTTEELRQKTKALLDKGKELSSLVAEFKEKETEDVTSLLKGGQGRTADERRRFFETYNPAKADALYPKYVGIPFNDPEVYGAANKNRVDARFFLKPVQDELLKHQDLLLNATATKASMVWLCVLSGAIGATLVIAVQSLI